MRLPRHRFTRSLLATSMTAALGIVALPAFAADNHAHDHASAVTQAAAEQARQQAYDHTQALMALQKRWEKAQGAEKSRALEQLVAKAEERRAFLLELMESNPAEVLRVAIPEEKQAGMPEEVVQKLEQKLELEGALESTYYDNFEKPELSKLKHELKTPFGERFELHFAEEAPELPFGSKVKAYGLLLGTDGETGTDGSVIVGGEGSEEYPISYAGADGSSNPSPDSIANDTFGAVKTLVILANFQDKREEPYTQAYAKDMVFTQVNNYFKENSYGQSWLTGDVTPWLTLPISGDFNACRDSNVTPYVDTAAQNAGYNVAAYDRVMIVTPKISCAYVGSAEVGGTRSRINGELILKTTAHELGHNYGLHHSKSLYCSNGTSISAGSPNWSGGLSGPWDNCKSAEYGNTVDVMGDSPSAHFHANQKEVLGWLEYGNSPDITEVTQSGRYEIDVMASQALSMRPKALKVLKSVDASTGIKTWYYIEFRQPVGFDSILNQHYAVSLVYPDNVLNGVIIHAVHGAGKPYQWLLDMTTDTTMLYPRDPALVVGKTFNSPDGDVSITTEWADSTKAVVDVNITGGGSGGSNPPATCTRAAPNLAFSPTVGPWVAGGTAVNYTVTLTNNDSSACSNSSYTLSATKPSGWSSTLGSSSLTLAPGASKSTMLTVTSSTDSLEGFYNVRVTAAGGGYSTSGEVTYVLDNPESPTNRAPTANNDSASTAYETPVTINVLGNDSDPDGDALAIRSTSGVNGTAKINSNGTITFTPASGFSGTTSFSYSVSDGNGGSANATVSVTVAAAPVASNRAPVAVDDNAATDANTSVTIAVLGNDYDLDGDTLTITGVTQGAKGSVRINANGTLTFTPAKNFKNGDSFGYTISDGKMSATATVNVAVTGGSSGGSAGNGKGPNK